MIHTPFAWPIFVSKDTFPIKPELIPYMENLPAQDTPTGNKLTTGSYILDMPKFAALKEFIQTQINEYFHDTLQVADEIEIYITQSWINFNPIGASHHQHSHPNSLVSGTFYIQGEPNTPIVFTRRDSQELFGSGGWAFPFKDLNIFNNNTFALNNPLNKVVLFPSHLQHEVPPNPNQTTRISLAFNTFVKGNLGHKLHLTELKL